MLRSPSIPKSFDFVDHIVTFSRIDTGFPLHKRNLSVDDLAVDLLPFECDAGYGSATNQFTVQKDEPFL